MSKWIRGIYNAAANFNMSGSLRAARARTLGGNRELVREELNKCDQPNKSCESNKSCSASTPCTGTPCPCARTTCNCSTSRSTTATEDRSVIIGNNVIPTPADYIERDYAEYTATVNAQGQGNSTGVWLSDEPRDFKHTNSATATDVEHTTGIPTGVTI